MDALALGGHTCFKPRCSSRANPDCLGCHLPLAWKAWQSQPPQAGSAWPGPVGQGRQDGAPKISKSVFRFPPKFSKYFSRLQAIIFSIIFPIIFSIIFSIIFARPCAGRWPAWPQPRPKSGKNLPARPARLPRNAEECRHHQTPLFTMFYACRLRTDDYRFYERDPGA